MNAFNFDVIFAPDSEDEKAHRAAQFVKGALRRVQALEGEAAREVFNGDAAAADARFTALRHYRAMLMEFGNDPRSRASAQYLLKRQIEERVEMDAVVREVVQAFSTPDTGYKS